MFFERISALGKDAQELTATTSALPRDLTLISIQYVKVTGKTGKDQVAPFCKLSLIYDILVCLMLPPHNLAIEHQVKRIPRQRMQSMLMTFSA